MTPKTKALRDEIISVISNDATIRHRYRGTQPGEMCVLGGLATHANIPLPKASDGLASHADDLNQRAIWSTDMSWLVASLYARYGLRQNELDRLQGINDRHSVLRERRAALIAAVTEMFADCTE